MADGIDSSALREMPGILEIKYENRGA